MSVDTRNLTSMSAAPPCGITLENITLSIDGVALFRDLDLRISSGEWTSLLGPSGVGKSMLLRIILDLVDGTHSGTLDCSGSVVGTDGAPLHDRVAYMAQRDLLYPWLSVRENVLLGARLRSQSAPSQAQRDMANELLEAVGLFDRADDLPERLSGGMRQRAALARTLAEDRPIVLMDEPFSALDAITKIKVQDLSARLLKGRSVLMVTHDPLEALRLSHNVIVMSGHPAQTAQPLVPDGSAPRSVDDAHVLEMQGALLHQLAEAAS